MLPGARSQESNSEIRQEIEIANDSPAETLSRGRGLYYYSQRLRGPSQNYRTRGEGSQRTCMYLGTMRGWGE